jgi:RAP domain
MDLSILTSCPLAWTGIHLCAAALARALICPSRLIFFPCPQTRMKHRHLAAMGWQVVAIPLEEWEPLRAGAERYEYLRRRIEG